MYGELRAYVKSREFEPLKLSGTHAGTHKLFLPKMTGGFSTASLVGVGGLVATHTWVDLHIPEAAKLADLSGIIYDLQHAQRFASLLSDVLNSEKPDWRLVEPLSIATTVTYCRPLMGGARDKIGETELQLLSEEQRMAHDHIMGYRNKHVAHSVNHLEENIPGADYCIERVAEEGITGISYRSGRVIGLSGDEIASIQELAAFFEAHIRLQINAEREHMLRIVRGIPLEKVLSGGQKAFVVDKSKHITERRK